MDQTNELFPDKFIFYTEACTGANPWDLQKVWISIYKVEISVGEFKRIN